MAGRVQTVQVGGVPLLVETSPVSGSEPTSKAGEVAERVSGTFEEVESAVLAVASRVAVLVDQLAGEATKPSLLQVQFGLKVSAKGNVIVAGASAEASLVVTIAYDRSEGKE